MGIFRFIFFVLLGYIIIKSFRFLMKIFFKGVSTSEKQKVYEPSHSKNKIDKKDVIDAKFEEIEVNKESKSDS